MTTSVLVIADDLTGGNSVAAGFVCAGARAVNVVDVDSYAACELGSTDVLVITSETRHCSPSVAEELTRRAVSLADAKLTGIRIDSTLRGNIPQVIKVVIEEHRQGARRAVALCVPAHPAAGRQTRDGIQLLHGVSLEQTALSADPLNPVSSSDVVVAVTAGSELTAGLLSIEFVTGPEDPLFARLRELAATCDVVVVDTMTEADIERVATVAGALAVELDWIPVDPGPFTVLLARELGLVAEQDPQPILVVSASTSELSRSQLRELADDFAVTILMPLHDTDAVALAAQVAKAAVHANVVILTSAIDESHLIDVDAAESARIVRDLGAVARRAMQERSFAALYCTGGDLAAEVVRSLDAIGIEAIDEIVPLAMLGRLIGGPWSGLPVVTKGGQVGTADTAVECIKRLRQHLQKERVNCAVQTRARNDPPIGREGK